MVFSLLYQWLPCHPFTLKFTTTLARTVNIMLIIIIRFPWGITRVNGSTKSSYIIGIVGLAHAVRWSASNKEILYAYGTFTWDLQLDHPYKIAKCQIWKQDISFPTKQKGTVTELKSISSWLSNTFNALHVFSLKTTKIKIYDKYINWIAYQVTQHYSKYEAMDA